jgi:hypothetical protein
MIYNFELHELFNSPKNVHLKALPYCIRGKIIELPSEIL